MELLERELYGEQPKAAAILHQDAAHERSEPTLDYLPTKALDSDAAEEEESPTGTAGTKPPKKGAAAVAESEEVVLARRADRKAELEEISSWNKGMSESLEKVQKRAERRRRTKLAMPLAARHGTDPGRLMIVRESDRESIERLDEVQAEIRERGLDKLEGYYVVYKRSDMFAMIFKFANVESAFQES